MPHFDVLFLQCVSLVDYSFAPSFFAFSMNAAATFLREILPVAPFGIVSTIQTLMGTLNYIIEKAGFTSAFPVRLAL